MKLKKEQFFRDNTIKLNWIISIRSDKDGNLLLIVHFEAGVEEDETLFFPSKNQII